MGKFWGGVKDHLELICAFSFDKEEAKYFRYSNITANIINFEYFHYKTIFVSAKKGQISHFFNKKK